MNKQELLNYYENLLQDNFLPYWFKFEDTEHGGILNCISNYGDEQVSCDKFTWSQGRWLWCLGELYTLKQKGYLKNIKTEDIVRQMNGTWDFIEKHSIYDDSICCFLLERDGTKKKDARTGRYDASIYADCFALIGMSKYIEVFGKKEKFNVVEKLYKSMKRRFDEKDYLTEPYPIPEGMETHSIPMIIIDTFHEYIKMKKSLGLDVSEEVAYVKEKIDFILNELYQPEGYILEYKRTDGSAAQDTVLENHVTPGHMLEDAWFMVEFLEDFGGLDEYLPKISNMAKTAFNYGWDKEFGGLFRYVDKSNGEPRGTNTGSAMENLILDTWHMKIWWPHTEALYALIKLYFVTNDQEFKEYYEKSAAYIFSVFPNKEIGEWIQIRKCDGTPEEKVVALPVKDPFHTLRSFIKIVEMCV